MNRNAKPKEGSRLKSFGKKFLTRAARKRLIRAVPFLGTVYAAYHATGKVQRKGLLRGGLDAALDLTPVVGRIKAVYEFLSEGDLIPPPTIVQYPVSSVPANVQQLSAS